ncbi:QWRF motif-containing protein 2-like isoform X2 [Zingiber officinale]|uniref:QWRF motif-containing protein 2-like isoform X2 n=1 Tax=Zingiber officinale TaxID=94328 RepID=UPI001C4C504F|nr:QWRF motif-containing protein 2-like isoform X2 [Zingiber officinale]
MAAAMAAAASRNPPHRRKSGSASPNRGDPLIPRRSPLIPSEKGNAGAAGGRWTRAKEIESRYLSSYGPASSFSTVTSFSSSGSSSSAWRSPSPLLAARPSTPRALPQSASQKRSHSVDRARPATPRAASRPATPEPSSSANRALCMTTRSLSVSFQGESFFYQTSRAKTASPSPTRKATPERRRSSASAAAPRKSGDHLENSKPFENHHRWPSSRVQPSNSLVDGLNYSSDKKETSLATFRLLQRSRMFDDCARRASLDGIDVSASFDTDSFSSGSSSGIRESKLSSREKVSPSWINVPARFCQETSRTGRHPEPYSPVSSPDSRSAGQQKLSLIKKPSVDGSLSSPRSASSPLRPMRTPSPSKLAASATRGLTALRTRSNASLGTSPLSHPGNAPSIISFAAEVRRTKKGENRIEEAHSLRLFDNRHLQWRFVNARSDTALLVEKLTVEKIIHNAWKTITELRDSITIKRIKLQRLTQHLKLFSILKGQMASLEELLILKRDHSSSLSGATEALKASTLRLPIVSGAKADILEVKDAVGSALNMMQVMGSSICSLLSKVEGVSSFASEITKLVLQEQALLSRSRNLLTTLAALHVKQCSIQGHLLQLRRTESER